MSDEIIPVADRQKLADDLCRAAMDVCVQIQNDTDPSILKDLKHAIFQYRVARSEWKS